jgi:hypothetical protein
MIDTATNRPVVPTDDHSFQAYYKSGYQGVHWSAIQNFPEGLRMIAGNAANTQPLPSGTYNPVSFSCVQSGARGQTIQNCSPGDVLVMTIVFPQCWDGVNLDSADHKSHMAYGRWGPVPGQNGAGCPTSHPVPLPEITQNFRFQVPASGTTTWRLSSDTYDGPAGLSAHADWMNGWHAPTFQRVIDNCFQRGVDCQMNLLGDGEALF